MEHKTRRKRIPERERERERERELKMVMNEKWRF